MRLLSRSAIAAAPDRHRIPWQPGDNGLKAATFDPANAPGVVAQARGFVYVMRMWVPETVTLANLHFYVAVAAGTPTANQCQAGIYSPAGVLLGKKADAAADYGAIGLATCALAAEAGQSLTIQGGPDSWVYAALLVNGAADPQLRTSAHNIDALNDLGLSAGAGWRIAYGSAGGLTALPANLPALSTAFGTIYWAGAS